MKDNFVKYNDSLKKQVTYCLIWFSLICIAGYFLYPVNTYDKYVIFVPFAAITSIVTIWLVNKSAKSVICPQCKSDIYEIIQTSKYRKLDFKFCPVCGHELQV